MEEPSREQSPTLGRLRTMAFRLRHALLFGWGVLWFLPPFEATMKVLNDWLPFEVGARILVHWHHLKVWSMPALHLYAGNPQLQIGPPPLLLLAPFERFSPHVVALAFGIAMVAAGAGALAAIEALAVRLADRPYRAGVSVFGYVGAFFVMPIWAHEVGYWHHLDDVIALLCVCVGMWVCARGGPWWLVALLAGTAVASKPWAIVMLPFVLGLPRQYWTRSFGLALGVAAAWWSPFVIAAPGTVRSLAAYRIYPDPGSALALFGLHGDVSTWLRPAEFGAGLAVAGYVAVRGRWMCAPLAGLAVRVLLDPYTYSYYSLGPVLAAMVCDLLSAGRGRALRLPAWTLATIVVDYVIPMTGSAAFAGLGRLAWVCTVLGVFLTRPTADVATARLSLARA
jgi:hypothetical protein